jgi:hypothetical protein
MNSALIPTAFPPAGYYETTVVSFFGQATGLEIKPCTVEPAEVQLMEFLLATDPATPGPVLWLIAKYGSEAAISGVASNPSATAIVLNGLPTTQSTLFHAALPTKATAARSVVQRRKKAS